VPNKFPTSTLDKALRFLSFRPRSEKEIRNHLKSKTQHALETVIQKLKSLDYVNDEEFATWWVEQRQKHSPRGARLIKSELYQKGVSQEIIDKVLLEDEEGEVGRALEAAKKKLRSYDLKSRESKQKMGQYLARRGFDWETIKETLDRLVDTPSEKG